MTSAQSKPRARSPKAGICVNRTARSEHLEQQKKYRGKRAAAVSHPLPDTARTQPHGIQGLRYHSIKVADGRRFQLNLLRQLVWWSFIKFMCLLIMGYRLEAINVISREVMLPRGLLGMGLDTLDWSGDEIKKVLILYAEPACLPSIVHCSHGKDRTGLICALVLMILDVPVEAIEHDYFLTDQVAVEVLHEREREFARIGLPEKWAGTDKRMIIGLRDHLDENYGGLDAYLDSIDVSKEMRYKIRENLQY